MAIIWAFIPSEHDGPVQHWLDIELLTQVEIRWIAIEHSGPIAGLEERIYVDNVPVGNDWENPEKLIQYMGDSFECCYAKVAIFKNHEDKVLFILKYS